MPAKAAPSAGMARPRKVSGLATTCPVSSGTRLRAPAAIQQEIGRHRDDRENEQRVGESVDAVMDVRQPCRLLPMIGALQFGVPLKQARQRRM